MKEVPIHALPDDALAAARKSHDWSVEYHTNQLAIALAAVAAIDAEVARRNAAGAAPEAGEVGK